MKCPSKGCFLPVHVLETRKGADGNTRRRYECGCGERFSTIEIHHEKARLASRMLAEIDALIGHNKEKRRRIV